MRCPETTGGYYGGPVNTGKFFDGADKKIYAARLNGVSFDPVKEEFKDNAPANSMLDRPCRKGYELPKV